MARELNLGGVVVATALPYKENPTAPAGLEVDYDRFGEHCEWLIDNGCRGVGPNGSLGEYSSLTDEERRRVVQTAVQAVAGRGVVVAGVHGPGWHQAKHWAELAAEDGANGVLCLPPTMYRSDRRGIVEHFEKVSEAGLPMMIYNNPFDTKVDLTPDIVAELAGIENVVAIKEFSADVRRAFEINDACEAAGTSIDVIAGADDVLFELMVDGAVGWFGGYPNVFPAETVAVYNYMVEGRYDEAREIYRSLIAAFRWDSRTEFVQAIKLGMDMVGRYGGPSRPPRTALSPEMEAQARADTQRALEALAHLTATTAS
ncbi:dihydrodipicolinate synthase family protein [Georgenia sp. SUBG003]|uniref:dihydrodipicolinate synthase family protein n=1 Tax=Georgenia sp. SUBG003 TaxID=1497974 RepID=UPI0004D79696|nr:dihydrodipicolinate synthase [Georgenia sp. SUBG003]